LSEQLLFFIDLGKNKEINLYFYTIFQQF